MVELPIRATIGALRGLRMAGWVHASRHRRQALRSERTLMSCASPKAHRVQSTRRSRRGLAFAMTAATVLVCVAAFGAVGSDAWWPIALGNVIRSDGAVPSGVPFAAAPTDGWVNTTVV